jgi:hypothetical protein
MPSIAEMLNTKRWAYWLDEGHPSPDNPDWFRVSIVFEGVSGHFPTGGDDKEPWYWSRETCKRRNKLHGYTELAVMEIVGSSIAAKRQTA